MEGNNTVSKVLKAIILDKSNLFLALTFFIICLIMIYNNVYNNLEKYTVRNGYVDKVSDTFMYVLKRETLLDVDTSKSSISVIEQGKRVAKNDVVAIYKTDKYDEYLQKMQDMDNQIETLVKDLPTVYSNDVETINEQINSLIVESRNLTSYVKMQEYKNKIDDLSYKKMILLGNLSPNGSKLRELIEERTKLEEESKKSSDNIISTASGVVSYKVDSLENSYNYDNILNLSVEEYGNIINRYNTEVKNNYGIKIVDNFQSYLLVKEPSGKNNDYIKEGKNYTIKLLSDTKASIRANLTKCIENESNFYCLFSIDNGIEDLVDSRKVSIEVIWNKTYGLCIPQKAIKHDTTQDFDYVLRLENSEYSIVPVKVIATNESNAIIENIDEELREKIGNKNKLKLYDQIVLQDITE